MIKVSTSKAATTLRNTLTFKSAKKSNNCSSPFKSKSNLNFRYTPILTDIDTKLKAFIPDYIPAVGEVDAFLKMPRPDGQPEVLGLNILVILFSFRINHVSTNQTKLKSSS